MSSRSRWPKRPNRGQRYIPNAEVGGRYRAKVSGRLVTVRVTEIKQMATAYTSRSRTIIYAVNESTGRQITIRSAQRLRPLPARGCELCNQLFNRPDGRFTCPYCGKVWEG